MDTNPKMASSYGYIGERNLKLGSRVYEHWPSDKNLPVLKMPVMVIKQQQLDDFKVIGSEKTKNLMIQR